MKKTVALFAASLAASMAHAYDVSSYVRENLVAQWDGIDNAGLGYHVAQTNIWKDLAGVYNLPLTSKGSWAGGDHLVVDNGCAANYGAIGPTGYKTIEIVYRQPTILDKNGGFIINVGAKSYYALARKDGRGVFFIAGNDYQALYPSCDGALRSVAAVYKPSQVNLAAVYTNGVDATDTKYNDSFNAGAGHLMLGDRTVATSYPFKGEIYAIRIYGTPLTSEQIATNAAVDAVRFFGATPTNLLHVTAAPYCLPAAISPGYAGRGDLSAGDSFPVSAPQGHVNLSADSYAVCTGWKLYDAAGAVVDHGDTLSFTYVHPTPAAYRRLEWQFDVFCRITASGTGGTYSPAEQWVRIGDTATVEATPNADGTYLYLWTDAATGRTSGDNPYAFTVTGPAALTASYRSCLWVAPDGNDANNGLTRSTAKATVAAAVALTTSVGDRVVVADGDYTLTANTTISSPCVVEAEHAGAARFFIGTAGFTAFNVKNADAVLRGVTVYSDRNVNLGAALLSVSSGKVIDCVFSNAICGEHSPVYLTGASSVIENCDVVALTSSGRNGGGLYITSDATARNCRVRKCVGNNNTYGTALFVEGGWAYGCLVACNTNSSTGTAGLHIRNGKGADGCTVVNNYSGGRVAPGLYCKDGKTARNCLAYGNRNAGGPLDTLGAGSFSYCATGTAAPAGTGNFQLGADPFANRAAEDYRVLAGPTVDAGAAQSWMNGAKDAAGNPRVLGSAPDIGCFETLPDALAVAAVPSAAFMLGDAAITLTATPAGTNLTGLVYTWVVTDQTGATVASASGDTAGSIVIPAGYGRYNVTVTVSNEAGETAAWTGESIAMRVPATLYVAKDSTPAFPYDTWETAAGDLATALAWCGDGSTVIMGDGVWTNTAATTVSRATTVKSLNGADATKIFCKAATTVMTLNHKLARIEGLTLFSDHTSRSMAALRIWDGTFADGVISNFFSSGAEIVNMSSQTAVFTNSVVIRNETSGRINTIHTTADDFDRSGGQVINCRIIGNVGNNGDYGTAICAYSGAATIRNCLILCNTNKSSSASAVNLYNNSGVLENCTIVGNRVNGSSSRAAVITSGAKPIIRNCIIHDNQNTGGVGNWSGTASCFTYCCTTPLPSEGNGNITPVEPMFTDDACHIGPGICKDAGVTQTWMDTATDLDGGVRIADDVVDLGCYEYVPGALECMAVPSAAYILGSGEVTLTASVSGADLAGLAFSWHVTDQTGRTVADVADSASATNLVLSLGYGLYDVSLTVRNARGAEAEFSAEGLFAVKPETVYVATDSTPTYPYDTHATAFTNVVDAIDFAETGMRVVIADGVYTNGTNPTIARNVTVESENGPGKVTVFAVNGSTVGWTLNSSGAILRGLTLLSDNANGANPNSGRPAAVRVASGTLDNCVVTNWYTYYTPLFSVSGSRAVVTNCTIVGCRTYYRCYFAGVYNGGLVTHSRFIRNISNTYSSAYGPIFHINDSGSTVRNCLVADNTTQSSPPDAGVFYLQNGVVENCTAAGNKSTGSSTVPTAYVAAGTFRNNIVWGNTNTSGESGVTAASASLVTYCCAPGLTGTGDIGEDPVFRNAAKGDYTLRGLSPCIDTGLNQSWMDGAADLSGAPRVHRGIARGTVDMGCFESPGLNATFLMLR